MISSSRENILVSDNNRKRGANKKRGADKICFQRLLAGARLKVCRTFPSKVDYLFDKLNFCEIKITSGIYLLT